LKKPLVIVGAGGHAKILLDIASKSAEFEVVGVVSKEDDPQDDIMGFKIYKGDNYLLEFKNKGVSSVAIGIGGYTNNNLRKEMYYRLKELGFEIANLIDPTAIISKTVKMGEGVVIFAGVIINTEVVIGNNVIIATGSTIDHETIIEDHVLVSAGVTVGAGDVIQEGALLALGSNVISRINIGMNSLIGAGAVVVNDIENNAKVFGVPAKPKGK
jgi:sugar O-acyltransferase (sialic acid O-acetyltransferase NeuD family)